MNVGHLFKQFEQSLGVNVVHILFKLGPPRSLCAPYAAHRGSVALVP